jgi:hypothetical protein
MSWVCYNTLLLGWVYPSITYRMHLSAKLPVHRLCPRRPTNNETAANRNKSFHPHIARVTIPSLQTKRSNEAKRSFVSPCCSGTGTFSRPFLTERDQQLLSAQPAPIHIGLDNYAFWAWSWLWGYCACVLDFGTWIADCGERRREGVCVCQRAVGYLGIACCAIMLNPLIIHIRYCLFLILHLYIRIPT